MAIADLRIIFCGESCPFTAASLRAVARRCKIVGIIESHKTSEASETALGGFARRRKIPYFKMTNPRQRPLEFIRSRDADVMCVAAFTYILRPDEFTAPRLGTINVHPSLLPKFRGPLPLLWQLHQMDLRGGSTVHFIDGGIDTGDIITQIEFPIELGMRLPELVKISDAAAARALIDALEKLDSGKISTQSQRDAACPFYARAIAPDEKLIDWNWPIERAWHFLRATNQYIDSLPAPESGGRWRIETIDRTAHDLSPGTIAEDDRGEFLALADGKIRLTRVNDQTFRRRFFNRVYGTFWHYKMWW